MSQVVKEQEANKASALENPEVLVEKLTSFEDYLEKHTKQIAIFAGVIALVIGGFFGYRWYQGTENEEAQKQMFSAVYYFESDSLNKALNGDGSAIGLKSIAEDYGHTKAGKLAKFYIGAIYLKQAKYQDAIDNLSGFHSDDLLISPRANCMIGDAYLELNDLEHALEYYKKAALHAPNKFFSPRYLMKAALVQELMKNYSEAINSYNQVIEKYYDSQEAPDARKMKARLEQMAPASK
jgi:predicted negative regulator of RcsB-dependent stress response